MTYYNNTLAGGKWQKMMDPYNYGDGQPVIEGMPSLAAVPAASGMLGVAIEGQTTGNEAATLKFSVYTDDRRFIDVFTKGAAGFSWTATTSQPWIKLTKMSGTITDEDRLWASIDWAAAPAGDGTGTITITAGAASKTINVGTSNPATPTRTDLDGYVESNGYVAIEAENISREGGPGRRRMARVQATGTQWRLREDAAGRCPPASPPIKPPPHQSWTTRSTSSAPARSRPPSTAFPP